MNQNQIRATDRWLTDLVSHLAQQYDLDGKVTVTLKDTKQSYHEISRDRQRHTLHFGRKMMHRFMTCGYQTYVTIHDRIDGLRWRHPQNLEALYWHTLHEFAHVLQTEAGERHFGSAHNAFFVECWNELAILFPFDEVLEDVPLGGPGAHLFSFERRELLNS